MNGTEKSVTIKLPKIPKAERPNRLLFVQPKEGQARFNVAQKDKFHLLAEEIGRLVLKSWKNGQPVMHVGIFGRTQIGKSEFANAVFSQLEGAEGLSLKSRTRMERIEATFPKCYHVDYWQYEGIRKAAYLKNPQAADELLISEWTEMLAEQELQADRIEVELLRTESEGDILKKYSEMKTPFPAHPNARFIQKNIYGKTFNVFTATVAGYGKGIELVEELKAAEDLKDIIL